MQVRHLYPLSPEPYRTHDNFVCLFLWWSLGSYAKVLLLAGLFYSFEGGPGPVEMARPDAGIPPDVRSVPLSNLTAEDLVHVRLEEMEFYTSDTMGPFVIVEDSERARTALEERLRPS